MLVLKIAISLLILSIVTFAATEAFDLSKGAWAYVRGWSLIVALTSMSVAILYMVWGL